MQIIQFYAFEFIRIEKNKNGIKMRTGKSIWTTLLIKIVYMPEQVSGDLLLTDLLFRVIFSSPENNVLRAKSDCNCGSSDWLRYARNGNIKSCWIIIIDFKKNMLLKRKFDTIKDSSSFTIQAFIIKCIKWIHLLRKLVRCL